MTDYQCDKCRRQEHIPTDQGIKFDDECEYLCTDCFGKYNEFMGAKLKGRGGLKAGKPSNLERRIAGECGRCGTTTEPVPVTNTIKNLRTLITHYLCDDDWEEFREWYHHQRPSQQDTPRPPTTGYRRP